MPLAWFDRHHALDYYYYSSCDRVTRTFRILHPRSQFPTPIIVIFDIRSFVLPAENLWQWLMGSKSASECTLSIAIEFIYYAKVTGTSHNKKLQKKSSSIWALSSWKIGWHGGNTISINFYANMYSQYSLLIESKRQPSNGKGCSRIQTAQRKYVKMKLFKWPHRSSFMQPWMDGGRAFVLKHI